MTVLIFVTSSKATSSHSVLSTYCSIEGQGRENLSSFIQDMKSNEAHAE